MADADSPNLYETLFPDSDDIDGRMDPGLLAVNNMFSHLNFTDISKYYDIQLYNNCFSNQNTGMLSIFHLNIRGAHSNKTNLETLIHILRHQPDVIALTETWFNDTDKENFLLENYQAFHAVRDSPHGGSSIFIKKTIDCELNTEFTLINSEIEIPEVTAFI